MLRILLGAILGTALAFGIVALIEGAANLLQPMPAGNDYATTEGLKRMMAVMPLGAELAIVAGWCVGTAGGAALAAWIGRREIGAWIVGGFMVAATAATMAQIPHPGWMIVAGLVGPAACAWGAGRIARRHRGL